LVWNDHSFVFLSIGLKWSFFCLSVYVFEMIILMSFCLLVWKDHSFVFLSMCLKWSFFLSFCLLVWNDHSFLSFCLCVWNNHSFVFLSMCLKWSFFCLSVCWFEILILLFSSLKSFISIWIMHHASRWDDRSDGLNFQNFSTNPFSFSVPFLFPLSIPFFFHPFFTFFFPFSHFFSLLFSLRF